jgi:hypothetical protein
LIVLIEDSSVSENVCLFLFVFIFQFVSPFDLSFIIFAMYNCIVYLLSNCDWYSTHRL